MIFHIRDKDGVAHSLLPLHVGGMSVGRGPQDGVAPIGERQYIVITMRDGSLIYPEGDADEIRARWEQALKPWVFARSSGA